jgi:hypothetical protein
MSVSWNATTFPTNLNCASHMPFRLTRPLVSLTLQCKNGMPHFWSTRLPHLPRVHSNQIHQDSQIGIANKAADEKISDAKAQDMVIAEVANVLQAQNAEQMKDMMAMFEKLLASAQAPAVPIVNPPKTPRQPRKECPHCSKKHANHEKCWGLDASKALRPANWKSTKTVA